MTAKEWHALELPITWGITYESEVKYPQTYEIGKSYRLSDMICQYCGTKGMTCDCYDKQVLNLDAPLPDGVYDVAEDDGYNRVSGITIKDGKFVPKPTAEALYRFVVNKYYPNPKYTEPIDHNCLEWIEWTGEYFEVFMGS